MKLAKKVLDLNEASHFNTKVRQLEGSGSRKIRLALKETKRMIDNMLDKKHSSPNPKTDIDRMALKESKTLLDQTMIRLKEVKETKGKKRY